MHVSNEIMNFTFKTIKEMKPPSQTRVTSCTNLEVFPIYSSQYILISSIPETKVSSDLNGSTSYRITKALASELKVQIFHPILVVIISLYFEHNVFACK